MQPGFLSPAFPFTRVVQFRGNDHSGESSDRDQRYVHWIRCRRSFDSVHTGSSSIRRIATNRRTSTWNAKAPGPSFGWIRYAWRKARIQTYGASTKLSYWRPGMSTLVSELSEARAQNVNVSDDALEVDLADGRTIIAPLAWFPRLGHATPSERANWRFIGGGEGIHWPELDEGQAARSGRPSQDSRPFPLGTGPVGNHQWDRANVPRKAVHPRLRQTF